MSRSPARRFLLCSFLIGAGGAALAQAPVPGRPVDEQKPPVWNATPTRTIRLFPAGDIYPVYIADPYRPTNAVVQGFYARTRIPDTSSPRTSLAAGGRFGVLRSDSSTPGGRAWQISLDAGLDAVFDSQFKNDAIGWDGNYGLTFTTTTASSPLGFKVAVLHVSSHLGDEYEERTSLKRINYTREELALGLSWRFRPRWRTYGDVGMAYRNRSDGQEPWRWQAGVEYEAKASVFGGRMAWYGAADFSAMEERDWRLDSVLQGGLVTWSGGHCYRIFAQWHDGRVPLGQFSQYSEASLSVGLKVDM